MRGRPGPAPPCATPTRDARHLPAHLPALSSQPGGLGRFLDAIVPHFLPRHRVAGGGELYQAPTSPLLGHSLPGTLPQQSAVTERCRRGRQGTLTTPWRVCKAVAAAVLAHKAKFSQTPPVLAI